jgi:2'-5' RNA ligase
VRLFIALNLDDVLRDRLHRDAAVLRAALPGASWVRARNLHLTIKFLGEVEAGAAAAVGDLLRPVAVGHPAIETWLGGAGAFPSLARPRVVWVGLHDDGSIAALAKDVEAACGALGLPAAERTFSAHVTLGRVRREPPRQSTTALRLAAGALEGPYPVRFEALDLMESELAPDGSRYSTVVSLPLGDA